MFEEFCREHNIDLSSESKERLEEYVELLSHFNQSMNLVGTSDKERICEEFVEDSLLACATAEPSGSLIDIGTGAGLPGIPIKLAYPELEATLVEPRGKRHTFLKIARHRLGLESTTLERARIEELDYGREFNYVISKAFRPPAEWLEVAEELLSEENGYIVCMTTRGEYKTIEEKGAELGLEVANKLEKSQKPEGRAVYALAREK